LKFPADLVLPHSLTSPYSLPFLDLALNSSWFSWILNPFHYSLDLDVHLLLHKLPSHPLWKLILPLISTFLQKHLLSFCVSRQQTELRFWFIPRVIVFNSVCWYYNANSLRGGHVFMVPTQVLKSWR
jgi:hypothetical protein